MSWRLPAAHSSQATRLPPSVNPGSPSPPDGWSPQWTLVLTLHDAPVGGLHTAIRSQAPLTPVARIATRAPSAASPTTRPGAPNRSGAVVVLPTDAAGTARAAAAAALAT